MKQDAIEAGLTRLLFQLKQRLGDGVGWIRAMRARQGMLGKELARKMHVSPARISVLERDELRGAVTLKMMQKAAEALDCTFVYAFVPRDRKLAPKPRIRLSSGLMHEDNARQRDDLQRQLARSLRETDGD